jgi:F420-0:gamma-glutamyl ligase
MKRATMKVQLEHLPDSVKDYRVANSVCHAITQELRRLYGNQVNVIVSDQDWRSLAEINEGRAA